MPNTKLEFLILFFNKIIGKPLNTHRHTFEPKCKEFKFPISNTKKVFYFLPMLFFVVGVYFFFAHME